MKFSRIGHEWRAWLGRWHEAWATPGFVASFALSILALIGSSTVYLLAVQYATERMSNPVTDIILSNIPAFDVDGFFVYGTFLFAVFIVLVLIARPKRIPFIIMSLALLWVIRACFTSMTHIAPFPSETPVAFGPTITKIFFGGDEFFSGHVGTPFLLALIFWKYRDMRAIFLGWAVYFMFIVLLGHLHYSIDVASAFFITYAVYHIALRFFPRSLGIFNSDAPLPAA